MTNKKGWFGFSLKPKPGIDSGNMNNKSEAVKKQIFSLFMKSVWNNFF